MRIFSLQLAACFCMYMAACSQEEDGTISIDLPTGGIENLRLTPEPGGGCMVCRYRPFLETSRLSIVDFGIYDNVMLLSVDVSGTGIMKWNPAGDCQYRIQDATSPVQRKGYTNTNPRWH